MAQWAGGGSSWAGGWLAPIALLDTGRRREAWAQRPARGPVRRCCPTPFSPCPDGKRQCLHLVGAVREPRRTGIFMKINPEISGVHLVFVGNFIPTMHTLAWFELHDLLPEGASDSTELQMAAPVMLTFSWEWLEFRATRGRLEFHTTHEPYIRICDLSGKLFRGPLGHMPITAVGINRDVHFCVKGPVKRSQVGRQLAPPEPWGRVGESLNLGGENERMPFLSMTGDCPDGRPSEDNIGVTVQSSVRTTDKRTGIYVGVNDHCTIMKDDPKAQKRFLESFNKRFDSSIKRSNDIVDQIMSLANNKGTG